MQRSSLNEHSVTTHMILEESPAEGPDTSEDEVDLIEFSGRVSWGVFLCQQTIQQGTQCLIEINTEIQNLIRQHNSDKMQEHNIEIQQLVEDRM